MASNAEQMRAWSGPAILTYGFRPFFLGAAVWASCAMVLWIPMLMGLVDLPTRFDPVTWHAHEFLFGYLGAVIAGFLLTAVPNWTGRLPVVGWPLGALFALWLLGRAAILLSAFVPPWAVALADLSLPLALAGFLAREIAVGRNWRNLVVLGMLLAFLAANAVFHMQASAGGFAGGGAGLRAGLGAGLMMIAVIGGRIIPSFTRNWLVKRRDSRLPSPPGQRFDQVALVLLLATLLLWVGRPDSPVTGGALLGSGLLHALRLARWRGMRCRAEPLVWVLHLGYAFLPLGALALGAAVLWPGIMTQAVAQHLWMAGAIGVMTLAVMTRATLGHTGQSLSAGRGTVLLYLCMVGATVARLAGGLMPAASGVFYTLSGLCWIAAFGGFAILYGPLLMRPRARG